MQIMYRVLGRALRGARRSRRAGLGKVGLLWIGKITKGESRSNAEERRGEGKGGETEENRRGEEREDGGVDRITFFQYATDSFPVHCH
jgi:hypothetical protein